MRTQAARRIGPGVEERDAGRSRSEISAARLRSRLFENVTACPKQSQTTDSLGGRAIRGGTSPRPAPRRISKKNPFTAADLTFPSEWLKFPPLRAEGARSESRSVMRTAKAALARRTCPLNQSDWRTGAASGRNPRNPRRGSAGVFDTNGGGWPLIPNSTQPYGAKPSVAP